MEKTKRHLVKSGLVLAVILGYVLIVSTHIFYLPRMTVHTRHSNNSIFKRKNENVQTTNSLDRIAKATFKASTTTDRLRISCLDISFLFSERNFKNIFQKIWPVNTHLFCCYRLIYLSYRVFRI